MQNFCILKFQAVANIRSFVIISFGLTPG